MCQRRGLVASRVKLLDSNARVLEQRLGPDITSPDAPLSDIRDRPAVVQQLRVALLWAFRRHLFAVWVHRPPRARPTHVDLQIAGDRVSVRQLQALLGGETRFELLDPSRSGPDSEVGAQGQVLRFPVPPPAPEAGVGPPPLLECVPLGARMLLHFKEFSPGFMVSVPADDEALSARRGTGAAAPSPAAQRTAPSAPAKDATIQFKVSPSHPNRGCCVGVRCAGLCLNLAILISPHYGDP